MTTTESSLTLQPNPDGTTRLEVKMSYNPVAGGLGHAIASIFGADPKSEMDADLIRMKRWENCVAIREFSHILLRKERLRHSLIRDAVRYL